MQNQPSSYGHPQPGYGAPVENRNAQLALYCGSGAVLCGVAAIPALYFGWRAQQEIKASPVPVKNAWMAQVGMGLGGVGALILLVAATRGSAPANNAKPAASASAVASTTPASTTSATAQRTSAVDGAADYWSSPELVELEDTGDRFMAGFWPLFGDARQKRHDEAREKLMKEKPAAWQAESAALWNAQAAEFDAKAADIKKKSYRCRLESSWASMTERSTSSRCGSKACRWSEAATLCSTASRRSRSTRRSARTTRSRT